jgi:hypothetical protein
VCGFTNPDHITHWFRRRLFGRQDPLDQGGERVGHKDCILFPGEQVVSTVQRHKAFGMLCRAEYLRGVVDADGLIQRCMKHHQCPLQPGDLPGEINAAHVIEELLADGERPAGKGDFGLSGLLDLIEVGGEILDHVFGVSRGANGCHQARLGHMTGCCEDRGTAKAVPDKQCRCRAGFAQPVSCSHQVLNIGGEIGIGELSFTGPQTGEIETQGGNTMFCQRSRDAAGSEDVLRAGEAMGKQRIGPRLDGWQVEARSQRVAQRTGELDTFGFNGHGCALL